MKNTTLCYIEKDGKYLMLHRTKKKNDLNQDKWIGVGGKFEENETPEECLLREVREETGLTLTDFRLCSVITFLSDCWEGGVYVPLPRHGLYRRAPGVRRGRTCVGGQGNGRRPAHLGGGTASS